MSDQFGNDGTGGFDWQTARINAEQAEIEHLRELVNGTIDRNSALASENARLRKDVVHWREARRSCIEAGDMMKEEIDHLRDLLSEALESEISDHWYVRVREALSHE